MVPPSSDRRRPPRLAATRAVGGVAVVAVHTANHAVGEGVGLTFGVGPEDEVAHLVIDRVDPAPLRVVLASALPVLGMHEVDLAVLIGAPAALAPIKIFEPHHAWGAQMIKAAETHHRAAKARRLVVREEVGEELVDPPALAEPRQHHFHEARRFVSGLLEPRRLDPRREVVKYELKFCPEPRESLTP